MTASRGARAGGLVAALAGTGWVVWWAACPSAADVPTAVTGDVPTSVTFDRLLVDVCGSLAVGVYLLLVASAGAVVLGSLLHERCPRLDRVVATLTPRRWRRLVLVACGVSLAAPVAMATAAVPDGCDARCSTHCAVRLDGLALPDLPTSSARSAGRAVVVRPGDSLWLIAARHLPDQADVRQIALHTQAWYATNRATIGSDPDLIYPGTRLVPPKGLP
jgi:LysM domain